MKSKISQNKVQDSQYFSDWEVTGFVSNKKVSTKK